MKLPWVKKLSLLQGILLSLLATFPVAAQIKPDATLPHNSLVIPKLGNVLQIDGGTRAGSNLFHSFTQFNMPTGGTAFFNNALDVSNIFSRVTGGSASNIDGILKANGTASLFLLNPNGIVFGKNAQLNIGGSFVATTANAIGFGTLGIFSASLPNNPSLLTVNPSAFLFNQIAAQSVNSQANLQVSTGNSLLLLGGNVSLDGSNGGQILAPGGRVELGGLAGTGTVGLNVNETILSLTFPLGVPRADVSLNNGVQVNVSAGGGGSIAVNANNLNMLGGSNLSAGIAKNSGAASSQGGDIDVNATDSITLDNGSFISNAVIGTGNAGNVSIATDAITIDHSSFINNVVFAIGIGNDGDISVSTKSLSLTNGGEINAWTSGQGNLGNITISASDSIKIDAGDVSSIVGSGAVGNSGNIDITSKSLSLTNGGRISASTRGQGNAGNVTISASDFINIDGGALEATTASGEGGNITLQANSLQLRHNSLISLISATAGNNGNGGNLNINANTIVDLENSNITAHAYQGEGGNIQIATQGLFNSPDSLITGSFDVGIQSQGVDVKNVLILITGKLVSTEQAIAGSCIARINKQQGRFIVTGNGGLVTTPYDFFHSRYRVIELQPLSAGQSVLPNQSTHESTHWKVGDPIVEATGIVRTPDGKVLLSSTPQNTPESASELVCYSNEDKPKS